MTNSDKHMLILTGIQRSIVYLVLVNLKAEHIGPFIPMYYIGPTYIFFSDLKKIKGLQNCHGADKKGWKNQSLMLYR